MSAYPRTVLIAIIALSLLSGCRSGRRPVAPTALFEDVAPAAGVTFTHTNGATGKFYYIENIPAGCAFLDYDNDGWLDILLIQSGSSEPYGTVSQRPHCALYHNNHDGTFTDVTAGSGLDADFGYAQGVAVGDYDNDGYPDIFLTAYGGNHLLHNEHGTGKFTDVTAKMGLDKVYSTGYATSAAFGDYDNDGRLDLYVCYYTAWTWNNDLPCRYGGDRLDYCSPEAYAPMHHRLYHNEGSRFRDVSAKAGITRAEGRGLAVAFLDYDGDGRQDIFVANDLGNHFLWHNNGDGTFTNRALEAGCATVGHGYMAGMGIALADYDHSGRESLFVTNFSGCPNALFRNQGNGLFTNMSDVAGVGQSHLPFLSFGCEFLDYDADGWPDLVTANGHVQTLIESQGKGVTYRERKQLLHNEGNGAFREVTENDLLGDLAEPTVARGLAVGDYDNDGRLDILVNNQNGPAQLFHNRDHSGNHWISFKTIGTKSNRDGLHTRFIVTAGGMRQTATVRAGSSFLSHSDTRLYFGLGRASRIDRVEIHWPSGICDTLRDLAVDRLYSVTEGRSKAVPWPDVPGKAKGGRR